MRGEPFDDGGTMRLDLFLWFVRLAKTRALARTLAQSGHVRISGRRAERAHQPVRVGHVLVVPTPARVIVARVLRLPHRRGPASEAQACYALIETPPAVRDDGESLASSD